jgi:hypothetical protein
MTYHGSFQVLPVDELRAGIHVLISVTLLRKIFITVNVTCYELGTGVQLDQAMGFPLAKGPSGAIYLGSEARYSSPSVIQAANV